MMPHIAECPSRPRTASWKPAPQISFSAPHGYALVIENGPPVGCRPHLAPRTNPREASVS